LSTSIFIADNIVYRRKGKSAQGKVLEDIHFSTFLVQGMAVPNTLKCQCSDKRLSQLERKQSSQFHNFPINIPHKINPL